MQKCALQERPVHMRFWSKVQVPQDRNQCWVWFGGSDQHGYGCLNTGLGKSMRAHRYSWVLHFGEIPDGLWVLHHCDNPSCVNPAHLWLGTQTDNMQDMAKKGRGGHITHPERVSRGANNGRCTHPERYPIGSRCSHAKLTEESVEEIKARYGLGSVTIRQLAAEFEVSFSAVQQLLAGRSWKHVK
jgi:hypothetical protein